jgi:hypothetical protein
LDYGQYWVVGMEFCQDIITELMRIRHNKLPFFQRGITAIYLDYINVSTGL